MNTISKIYSRILASRFSDGLEENNILYEGQSGFRRGRSTVDNIFMLENVINLKMKYGCKKSVSFFYRYESRIRLF